MDLEKVIQTSDDWITSRTGIKSRHIAGKGEQNYQLSTLAAQQALENAGVAAEELDLIIVATISSHMLMPSTACFVQAELKAVNAFAYDINAACSGFLYGLEQADRYIKANGEMKILLIGAETLSARLNWEDRNTCILFGDGAGAVVVSGNDENRGVFGSIMRSDGQLWKLLCMDSPESTNPELRTSDWQGPFIQMSGRDVFKHAVRAMEEAVVDLLRQHELTTDQINLIIPHQANVRILGKLTERLGVSQEKVYINVDKYGNTSAASIPIALDEAHKTGRLQQGDIILFCSFGGGFTWGSLLMRW